VKVVTILGTRPELIRLSLVLEKLDRLCDRHVVVHTGQNYDDRLRDVFFRELGLRAPDHHLGARGSFGEQVGTILSGLERVLAAERPDRFLVLGDTNSSLGAIVAKRLGVAVYHMEAGNRCYDDRVPEEVNRRIIDHCSDVLLPYTERSRANLLREGIPGERVYVTGNPIYEVIHHYERQIEASSVLRQLDLEAGRYFVVTVHRAENVDVEWRLRSLTAAFARLAAEFDLPVIVSTHPRTRSRLDVLGAMEAGRVRYLPPFGFFDFLALERQAHCVLTDSGTVQEECAILGVANVTIRDVTERPETIECGSNVLSGADADDVVRCVRTALSVHGRWSAPPEYLVENVSDTVVKIVTGFLYPPPGDRGSSR
jgi:UDP-N-acetylglucosamine 2-epimerase (non-hydrolysing)